MKFDRTRRLVRTRNSIYRSGEEGRGEPPLHELLHVCAMLHVWGFGKYIDAPEIFY
jgi:hypothetical protein